MYGKTMSTQDALGLIKDGDTVAVGGFVGNVNPEELTAELENIFLDSGGIVIAQVERISENGRFRPMDVKIPGIFVDAIVIAKPKNHWQTFLETYNPAYCGEIYVPDSQMGKHAHH